MGVAVHHGDMLAEIPLLVAEGVVCDAVVTDPPYGLEFMSVKWDSFKIPKGVSKPSVNWGDFGSREHPRNVGSTARIMANKSRAFQEFTESWAHEVYTILRPGAFLVAFGGTRTYHRLVCGLEDAGFVIQDTIAWLYGSGFPKHRDMLKPAFEPIVLAYKPGGKRTMQINECRIGTESLPAHIRGVADSRWRTAVVGAVTPERDGRWPANVCHDGSEEVAEAFPWSVSGEPRIRSGSRERQSDFHMTDGNGGFGDTGSAARFFYCAKADKQDRWGSRHPTVKPVELMKWLVALVTPPGGLVLDPFAGTGTTGVAALATGRNAILIERETAYAADIRERLAFYEGSGAHSVQAKNRSRKVDEGPLFAAPFDPEADSIGSYHAAIEEIGRRVKAGDPLPTTGYFGPTQSRGES